jgi:hypothetical protein
MGRFHTRSRITIYVFILDDADYTGNLRSSRDFFGRRTPSGYVGGH